jgi:hypothetical protein
LPAEDVIESHTLGFDELAVRVVIRSGDAAETCWRLALALPDRGASVRSMIWHRPSKRVWRGRRTLNLLIRLLDRFADPSDYQASDALSLVQQSWEYDDPRSTGQILPVLLENRIEVLSQVASLVDQK